MPARVTSAVWKCAAALALVAALACWPATPACPAPSLPPAAEAAPPVRVRPDGFITIGGKPFFPIGIYHDSLDADYYGEPFIEDLQTIADAGFNFVHVSMDFTYDGDTPESSIAGRAANLAQKRGLRLGMAVYLKNLDAVVREQSRWPAILMASLGDDFNSDAKGRLKGPPKFPPERLAELHRRAKAIAPNLLTYSSGTSFPGARLEGYEATVDCIGIQCYTVGDGSQSVRNELEAMEDRVANYWRLAGPKANKCLIVNLQAFASDGKRWPKPNEVRLQAWVSLLGGARGLVWYSFLQEGKKTLPKTSPATWDELRRLVPELKQVTGYVTDGKLTAIPNPADKSFDDGPGTWHAGFWTLDKRGLLVVVNTRRDVDVEIDFALPEWKKMEGLLDADRYGRTLTLGTARVQGRIAPASTQVYLLEK